MHEFAIVSRIYNYIKMTVYKLRIYYFLKDPFTMFPVIRQSIAIIIFMGDETIDSSLFLDICFSLLWYNKSVLIRIYHENEIYIILYTFWYDHLLALFIYTALP